MDLTGIIERALARTEGMGNAERARSIQTYIDIAQDLAGVPMPSDIRRPEAKPIAAKSVRVGRLIVTPDADEPPPPRMVARVRPQENTEGAQYRTIDEICEYLKRAAPTTLDIDLGDDKQPVRLSRVIQPESSDIGKRGDGIVRLSYIPRGQEDGPTIIFSSADKDIALDAALDQIEQAAKGMMSREKRHVQARPAKPFLFDIEDTVRNGPGGDADDVQDAGAALDRMAPRDSAALNFIRGA